MKQLIKFIYLPIEEKILFFLSVYYLTIFRIRLITASPKVLFLTVSKKSNAVLPFMSCPIASDRIAIIINKASRFVPYSTCLSIAFAGHIVFAKNSYKTELHVGVLKNENRHLEAHAWLSYGETVILGSLPDLVRFQELPLKSFWS